MAQTETYRYRKIGEGPLAEYVVIRASDGAELGTLVGTWILGPKTWRLANPRTPDDKDLAHNTRPEMAVALDALQRARAATYTTGQEITYTSGLWGTDRTTATVISRDEDTLHVQGPDGPEDIRMSRVANAAIVNGALPRYAPHPLDIDCPLCGAQRGFGCRRARSMKDARWISLKNPHAQRIEAARTAV